jgi:hypothetical protein
LAHRDRLASLPHLRHLTESEAEYKVAFEIDSLGS